MPVKECEQFLVDYGGLNVSTNSLIGAAFPHLESVLALWTALTVECNQANVLRLLNPGIKKGLWLGLLSFGERPVTCKKSDYHETDILGRS